jgi:8-oxo-dGTP diphosphatase
VSYTYQYARPALTVDCILFTVNFVSKQLEVLLIRRKHDPFKNCLAHPGGFVNVGECTEDAAKRELEEETGFKIDFLEQLYTFSSPNRDPREHVVTVAYYGLVPKQQVQGADDALEAIWVPVENVIGPKKREQLAFDHENILKVAHERLTSKLRYAPVGFNLLPEKFTLNELHQLYEIVLMKEIHKANFRTKMLSMDILVEVGVQEDVSHRPAKIYSFDAEKYNNAINNGFNFQI